MSDLNIGSHKLPLNAATKTFAILAKRGAGKTYTGAVMAEEFFKNNIPFVVFDPIDVWFGLRFASDGKSKGLPVVVFGVEHADIKLDRDMGRKIAQAIVKNNISCVISTFGLPKVAQRHLIAEFAEELLNINNTPRHIFIEEAHEYIPQRVFGAMGKTFNAVSNLIVMGRNRGIGVTILNQRAATVNKDVLTQIDTLLAFRNIAPQDRNALKDWVEYHAAEGDFDKFMQSLPSLPTGEGWIWSPEFLGIFERIKIRERETFHPDREKLGEKVTIPQLEQTDIQDFIKSFTAEVKKVPQKEQELGFGEQPLISETITLSKEIMALKNEYESKLLQKDLDIRKREEVLNQIKKMLGVTENGQIRPVLTSNLEMWLEKLGKSMPSVILKFLAEKSGLTFTKSQIALACRYAASGGSFSNAISLLRRNNLIISEGDRIKINPNL